MQTGGRCVGVTAALARADEADEAAKLPHRPVSPSCAKGFCRTTASRGDHPPPLDHDLCRSDDDRTLLHEVGDDLRRLEGDNELGALRHRLDQPDSTVGLECDEKVRLREGPREEVFGSVHEHRTVDRVVA
eukprot:scaffold207657_cov27-Tisochrysis_lutea.AAC.5